jgi:uncharacterized protein YlxP (DUF503 family)
MVTGTLKLRIHLAGCSSLKEKRSVRQRITSRIRNTFKVAVAEVDTQDVWETLTLGIATLGPDKTPVESVLRRVADFVEDLGEGRLESEELDFIRG